MAKPKLKKIGNRRVLHVKDLWWRGEDLIVVTKEEGKIIYKNCVTKKYESSVEQSGKGIKVVRAQLYTHEQAEKIG